MNPSRYLRASEIHTPRSPMNFGSSTLSLNQLRFNGPLRTPSNIIVFVTEGNNMPMFKAETDFGSIAGTIPIRSIRRIESFSPSQELLFVTWLYYTGDLIRMIYDVYDVRAICPN